MQLTIYFCLSLSLLLISVAHLRGQDEKPLDLPQCDIYLFELDLENGFIQNGKNITGQHGYENQPWFTPDSKSILFSADSKSDRTDIFEYFIKTGEIKQVTDTPTQEYSPQISPDNKWLSFVTDGETANQSIWKVARENDQEEWLLANQGEREPVGYYSWNHRTQKILFWSRYGFSMRLVDEAGELSHYVTGDAVPSTPYIIPGTNKFSFMHRQGNGEVWIKELDPETLAVRPLTLVKGNNPNYGWAPDGSILMIDGTTLYRKKIKKGADWKQLAELSRHGLGSATRLAVSPNSKYLAVVGLSPLETP